MRVSYSVMAAGALLWLAGPSAIAGDLSASQVPEAYGSGTVGSAASVTGNVAASQIQGRVQQSVTADDIRRWNKTRDALERDATTVAYDIGFCGVARTTLELTQREKSLELPNQVDPCSALETAVRAIIGPMGHFTASPSNGLLVVTAAANMQERVQTALADAKAASLRATAITVRGYRITAIEGDDAAKLWQLATDAAASAAEHPDSEAAMRLSMAGSVTAVLGFNTEAFNGRLVPLRQVHVQTYPVGRFQQQALSSSTTSVQGSEFETVWRNSTFLLLPVIDGERNVTLQVAYDETTSTGADPAQATPSSQSAFNSQVRLRPGQSSVLFMGMVDQVAERGAPAPWLLGGDDRLACHSNCEERPSVVVFLVGASPIQAKI